MPTRSSVAQYFDALATPDQGMAPKPSSEMLISLHREVGVHPQDCLVVESSFRGALASVAAGCFTILLVNDYTLPGLDSRRGVEILPNSQALADWFNAFFPTDSPSQPSVGVERSQSVQAHKASQSVQGPMSQAYPFRVFLSHASSDLGRVRRVVRSLEDANISCWIDEEQISYGDSITEKIEEGLRRSRFVVVCLSYNFAKSGWCRAEYEPILKRVLDGDDSQGVIPLSLDGLHDTSSIPLLLDGRMRADFTNKASFQKFIGFLQKPDSSGSTRRSRRRRSSP